MKTNIQQRSLTDCLDNVIDYRGKTPKKLGLEWCNVGYRAISANNVKFDGLTKIDSINCLDEAGYKKWMKEEVKKGDLLLTSEAPAGQVMLWMNDEKIVLSQRLFALRTKPDVYNKYLKYYLQSNIGQFEINKNTSGSTVFGISAKMFDFIKVNLPDYDSQISIGDLLYLIDSKIELNNRINAELEAMVKTLYDYWFVQFDFPDVNGKPYKSSGGKMVWNEELKREIPEGWNVNFLGDWIGKDKSGDWGKEEKEGNYIERVFCIRGADLNGLNGKGEVKAPERFILEKNTHKILEPHDLIVEISGGSPTQSTGRMAYITNDTLQRFDAPIICSNFCKAVTLKEQKSLFNFAFEWNKAYNHGVLFGYEGKTSGIKNLLFESFVSSYLVPSAPISLMEKFYELMTPIESKKQLYLLENQQLTTLRDWLLPMLMNGQVKI